MWISWIVLAASAVITQSLPLPDQAYNIPAVPAAERVQYYVLHDDGTYKYGYDSGVGQYESAVKMGDELNGAFGFKNSDGQNVRVDYTAGVNGFVPVHSVVPGEPSKPTAAVEYSADKSIEAEEPTPVVKSASSAVEPESTVVEEVHTVEEDNNQNSDSSYFFKYSNSESSRDEFSDHNLNVKGSYRYTGDDGVERKVSYIAGSDTGFVAEGDHIPVAPAAESSVSAADETPILKTADAVAPASSNSEINPAYFFQYTNTDSSRKEFADHNLDVKGSYTFVADDGVEREVKYVAGSSTGFVAEGGHLPAAPEAEATVVSSDITVPETINLRSAVAVDEIPVAVALVESAAVEESVSEAESPILKSEAGVSIEPAAQTAPIIKNTDESSSQVEAVVPNSAYFFQYTNTDSSRTEFADHNLDVKGSYTYIADDGVEREVRYLAGSDTGFVAEGDHLPVVSSDVTVPETPSLKSAVVDGEMPAAVAPVETVPVEAPVSEVESPILKTAVVVSAEASPAEIVPVEESVSKVDSPVVKSSNNLEADSSYFFKYSNAESSRDEFSDHNLNVKGSYKYIGDDGIERIVTYIAGSDTGFVAEGDHIPVVVAAPSVLETPVLKSAEPVSAVNADSAYFFQYTNADSSRDEFADHNLNVKGSYKFIGDDGVERIVTYVAGSDTGFVAEGDHIPASAALVAPENPIVVPVVAVAPAVPESPILKSAEPSISSVNAVDADSSYFFQYTNAESSRDEFADHNLNVKGSYKFIGDDGVERIVTYVAGSDTGFVAEGDHIPASPALVVPENSAVIPVVAVPETPVLKSAEPSISSVNAVDADSAYYFQYTNAESSRDEFSDHNLNVKGSYKFIADDGIERIVKYVAGSDTGFVAEGDHIPIAPALLPAEVSVVDVPILKTAEVSDSSANTEAAGTNPDSAYFFQYTNSDSSRDEFSDHNLNVKGSYKFIADDGIQRIVNYVAGSDTGFVATGDHLTHTAEVPTPILKTAVVSENAISDGLDSIHLSNRGAFDVATLRKSEHNAIPSHFDGIISNVHLRQYGTDRRRNKFGYVFTEV